MKKRANDVPVSLPDPAAGVPPERRERADRAPKRAPIVTEFGTQPAAATHWKAWRIGADGAREAEPLKAFNAGGGMAVAKFAIGELSEEAIRSRWGAGAYVLSFYGPRQGKGSCVLLGWGEPFEIGGGAVHAAHVVAPDAAGAATDPVTMFERIHGLAREQAAHEDARVEQQLNGLAKLAAIISGNQVAAQQAAQQQAQGQVATAIAELANAVNAMNARLVALESGEEIEDEGEDDDDGEEDEDEDDEEVEAKPRDLAETLMDLANRYGPAFETAVAFVQAKMGPAPAAQMTNGAPSSAPAQGPAAAVTNAT